jgi:hypothetical protein
MLCVSCAALQLLVPSIQSAGVKGAVSVLFRTCKVAWVLGLVGLNGLMLSGKASAALYHAPLTVCLLSSHDPLLLLRVHDAA